MVYDCLKILAIDTGELQPDAIGMGRLRGIKRDLCRRKRMLIFGILQVSFWTMWWRKSSMMA